MVMSTVRKRENAAPLGSPSTTGPQPNSKDRGSRPLESLSPVRKTTIHQNYWTPSVTKSLFFLCLVSFIIRFALINEPSEVVFDEVHFGGFASNYLRREYFFDVHPPLGKLIIAGVGWLFGYDGGFTFATIGQSYTNSSAPYVALRTFMVLLGVASIGMSYATLIEMGFSALCATVAGGLLAFDNALVIQSRFILLDSILMFFISAAVFTWVKFRQQRSKPFKLEWWIWLVASGFSIGSATSVKMVGLFTVGLLGVATIIDLWELADWKRQYSDKLVAKHFMCRAAALIGLPIFVYLASYWIHFAILTRTGPGDTFMSADFQTGLQGNQMHEKSREIYLGHTIRLKSRLEEIYLHSHPHNYPRVHDDGKISSEGQQVTGYPGKDMNNLWKILPAGKDNDISYKSRIPINNGDLIRLQHVGTGGILYTHDVASPLTRTNMEITLANLTDTEKYERTLWSVDIKSGGSVLKALSCQFRLVNKAYTVFLMNQQQPLPKWGFGQREINGDKRGVDENSKWIVWDVEDPMDEAEKKMKAQEPKPKLTFFQKFTELQRAQVRHNAGLIDNHPFKSDPSSWPFVLRGISYWDKNKMGRIYLLGNPVGWYICLAGLVLFSVFAIKELYRIRRGKKTTAENSYDNRFTYRAGFLLLAWTLHYFPFFTMARTLYLHHYLPALIMSAMVTGAILDYYMVHTRHPVLIKPMIGIISVTVVATFFYFAPITYGTQISTLSLESKKWLSTWDWP
jgi:dolichyl-phosphate-mannose-protein mannosyltransferase